ASHNSLATGHILLAGSEAQKEAVLPKLAAGEALGAWGLTEPGSGSDAAALKTKAEKVPEGWVLNGTKQFITQGSVAGVYVVMARTEKGISAFLVERDTPGLSFGPPEEKMGLHAAHTAEVRLEEVFVPEENLLGEEGRGLAYALAGRMDIDFTTEPLGFDPNGKPVYLKDIWPSMKEIQEAIQKTLDPELFMKEYSRVFVGDEGWQALPAPTGDLYGCDPVRT
ncbi:acyl-CoA dehydrogenase family protein, partial [Shewanella sp. C31]|nr:acyl-CoA dehydrogenase family protein [Shewanella electrica]